MTRHELKEQLQHDQFTDAVSHLLNYTVSNRQRLIRIAIAVGIGLVVLAAGLWYSSYKRSQRQQALQAAFAVLEAQVGPANDYLKTYPTEDAKKQAALKAFSEVAAKYPGSREGLYAQYYEGTMKAQEGDKGAETDLKAVADSRSDAAPLAKIALAQLYLGQNKTPEAQQLLRSLINKPTDLVSKGQAGVLLAKLDQTASPQQVKTILDSLKTDKDPAITRAVDQINSQLAQ